MRMVGPEMSKGTHQRYRDRLLEELWRYAQEAGLLLPPRVSSEGGKRSCVTNDYQDMVQNVLSLAEQLPTPDSDDVEREVRRLLNDCSPEQLRARAVGEIIGVMKTAFEG
jgi:hypothetical protein